MPHEIAPADIRRQVLADGDVSVAVLNLGCITQNWRVPHRGARVPVVLGYDDPAAYIDNPFYLGALVGRVANRIAGAGFTLNGTSHRLAANTPPHVLHGGAGGIGKRLWTMETDGSRALQLRLTSPDGDQGFPGRADFTVTISLSGPTLTHDMQATVDRPTPINLAHHNYFNLMGHGTARDHVLHIPSDHVTEVDADMIPTGRLLPVAGTRHDFNRPRALSEADPRAEGYDENHVLTGDTVTLAAPNGLTLKLHTDQPGLQLYSSRYLAPRHTPLADQSHAPYSAICLEAQHFPDAVNHPHFPSIIATPDAPYRQRLSVTIGAAS